jgi:outer membrane protein assembly factor BamB
MRVVLLLSLLVSTALAGPNWPGFRGQGDSLTTARDLPLKWSAEEGIAWTASLKGYGQSSPVVWGGTVFVTSIEGPDKESLHVAAFEVKTGKSLWTQTFKSSKQSELTDYVSKAAPTPVVDGERVVAFFESGDLIALDHAGKTLWQRALTNEYGNFEGNHGIGSSLAQTEKHIIVLIDHSGPGYLLAIDKATGKNAWKVDREKRVSWSSPIVVGDGGSSEIVISSNGILEAFDAADGKRMWFRDGLKGNTVASPTVTKDAIYIGADGRAPGDKPDNIAVKRGGKDRLADEAILWRAEKATNSFGSPLVFDGVAYFTSKAGIAFALDPKTGKELWSLRLGDSCWASPIGAGDRVYFFQTKGKTTVIKSGPPAAGTEPQMLAENTVGIDGRIYGVAPVDGAFLIRNGTKLICVGKP